MIIIQMTEKKKQYVWYCLRRSCGSILLKTSKPFLSDDGVIKCYHCNEKYTFQQLFNGNKHNINKYIKNNNKVKLGKT